MAVDSIWFATRDYRSLLSQVKETRGFDRRCLLLAVACARSVSDRIILPACRDALEVAEQAVRLFRTDPGAAMALLTQAYDPRLAMDFPERLRRQAPCYQEAYEYQRAVGCKSWDRVAMWTVYPNPYGAFINAADLVSVLLSRGDRESVRAQKAIICEMARDVFEPPTKSGCPQVGPRTTEVIEAAAAIDRIGNYSSVPTLLDMLETAGCVDPAVLKHHDWSGTHIRGCWVVDQLLDEKAADP